MSQEELLERINNIDATTIEGMSPDVLAILTNHFEESLVRAVMYRGKNNYEQKRIIKALKRAYKDWKKDTDILWGAMPYMETYPDFLERMKVDVECGMIVTEDGSIPVPPKKPFKATYVPASAIRQHVAGTIAAETPDISKYEARIKELEAENEQLKINIKEKDAEIDSLKKLLKEQSNANNTNTENDNTDEIIEQLKPIFWGDEEQIKSFLEKIRGKKNTAVIAVIADEVTDRTISEQSCRRDLWSILDKYNLYKASESNYNQALNKALAARKKNKGL